MRDKEEVFNMATPKAAECKTCVYALKAVEFDGVTYERYAYGTCAKYARKPNSILWYGEKCDERKEGKNEYSG